MPASWGCKRRPLRAKAALGDQPLVPLVCHNLGLLPWLFLQAAPFSRSLPETQQAGKSGAGVFDIPRTASPCKHTIILLGCAPAPGDRLWEQCSQPSPEEMPQSQWIWDPALYTSPQSRDKLESLGIWAQRPYGSLLVLPLWASENQPCTAEDLVPIMTCSGHPWSWGTRP